MLTHNAIRTSITFHGHMLLIIAICASESNCCMVIIYAGDMQGLELMGLTGFDCLIGDELDTVSCRRDYMHRYNCGFLEANLT